MVLGDLDRYMQRNETTPQIYTIHQNSKEMKLRHKITLHQNKLEMDKRLKYKSQHHKSPRGEYRQ